VTVDDAVGAGQLLPMLAVGRVPYGRSAVHSAPCEQPQRARRHRGHHRSTLVGGGGGGVEDGVVRYREERLARVFRHPYSGPHAWAGASGADHDFTASPICCRVGGGGTFSGWGRQCRLGPPGRVGRGPHGRDFWAPILELRPGYEPVPAGARCDYSRQGAGRTAAEVERDAAFSLPCIWL